MPSSDMCRADNPKVGERPALEWADPICALGKWTENGAPVGAPRANHQEEGGISVRKRLRRAT